MQNITFIISTRVPIRSYTSILETYILLLFMHHSISANKQLICCTNIFSFLLHLPSYLNLLLQCLPVKSMCIAVQLTNNCTSRQAAVSSDKNTLSSEMRMRLQIYSAQWSMFTGVENTVTIKTVDVQTRGYPGCITCFWFIAQFQICQKTKRVNNFL